MNEKRIGKYKRKLVEEEVVELVYIFLSFFYDDHSRLSRRATCATPWRVVTGGLGYESPALLAESLAFPVSECVCSLASVLLFSRRE